MTNPPAARQILHDVFGYPEFRGRQERIVNTLAEGKDFYQVIQGCWGVEIGEMDSFGKADVTAVKVAITRRTDRCECPGARYAVPGWTFSPCSASLTRNWHRPSRRLANEAVNISGMCCTIRMPGILAGKEHSTSLMASVPPVEAPMSTSFSCNSRSGKLPAPPLPGSKGSCSKGFGLDVRVTGTLRRAL